jgi:hypothetical protein
MIVKAVKSVSSVKSIPSVKSVKSVKSRIEKDKVKKELKICVTENVDVNQLRKFLLQMY